MLIPALFTSSSVYDSPDTEALVQIHYLLHANSYVLSIPITGTVLEMAAHS